MKFCDFLSRAPRGTFEYFLPLWASLFASALWAVVPALGGHFSLAGAGVFTYAPTLNSIVLGGWVGGPSINNLARTIMNSKMAQIHDKVCGPVSPKMLFSRPARDFLPTRANIVCFRRSSISVVLGDRIVCG